MAETVIKSESAEVTSINVVDAGEYDRVTISIKWEDDDQYEQFVFETKAGKFNIREKLTVEIKRADRR